VASLDEAIQAVADTHFAGTNDFATKTGKACDVAFESDRGDIWTPV
jgi:hypothetical protein